ncbi:hypothetical protein [Burkholderia gladioli]|uniref:hypothetical protein n=1 Tax=Burkholderia gladioli TaxID=28095 RepID=UPI0016418260|nr:hypothetical protein [Burkholderia gladioli]
MAAGRAPGRGVVLELGLSRGAPLARGERLAGAELVDLVRWRRPRPVIRWPPGAHLVAVPYLSWGCRAARRWREASAWPAPSWSTWCAGAGRGGVIRWPPGAHLVAVS